MKKKTSIYILWALLFAGIFLVLCRIGYSDGDDAFFYEYTHQMGFAEYLKWRYETWVGRVAAEALVYLNFHMGIWFWRVVNACMMILLPVGILHLAEKAAGKKEYDVLTAAAAASGYLLMSVMTLGYAAIWVNGSIFYTWSFTGGIYALFPLADAVFGKTGDWYRYLYAIPCGIIAAMSIEQMGAVLCALYVAGILSLLIRKRDVPVFIWILFFVFAASFLILFAAPGNALRVAEETKNWLPQYEELTVGGHLFLTVQWLISSFANENRLFLAALWIAGGMLLYEKKGHFLWLFFAGGFTVSAFLSFAGVTLFSDMGISIPDITVCVEQVPVIEDLTAGNWFALVWWGAALVFTFFFLWKATGFSVILLLVYLAGIASEAVMYFSPTIYASGARVYYLTDLLYLFLLLCMAMRLQGKKRRQLLYTAVILLGAANTVEQIPVIIQNF